MMVTLAVLSVTVKGSNGTATRLSMKLSSGSTLKSSVRPRLVQQCLQSLSHQGPIWTEFEDYYSPRELKNEKSIAMKEMLTINAY